MLYSLIKNEDLIAREFRYHSKCYRDFILEKKSGIKKRCIYVEFYYQVKNTVEEHTTEDDEDPDVTAKTLLLYIR